MNDKLEKILSKTGDLNFKRRIKKIFETLELNEHDTLLDCGCGDGFYTVIASEISDATITAVDNDTDLLRQAEKNLRRKNSVTFVDADITKTLPFPDNTFTKIIFSEVLEHLEEEDSILKELNRVLKPGGLLVITVPHKNYPFNWDPLNWVSEHLGFGHFDAKNPIVGGIWSYDHKHLYSKDDLKNKLEKNNFVVSTMLGFTHFCIPFNLLLLYLGKQLYTSLPISKEAKSNFEKFDWSYDDKPAKPWVEIPFRFVKYIDSFNKEIELTNDDSSNYSFVTLFCSAKKKINE